MYMVTKKRLPIQLSTDTLDTVATLYIVGTPIGNLGDITSRGRETLSSVGAVFCEDTRRTRKLLSALGISVRTVSCRSQNEASCSEYAVSLLGEGRNLAFVSDAGTPGVSDPGATLVRTVRAAGYPVLPIPGPSAITALTSVSGMPSDRLLFGGFLSPKAGRRRRELQELLSFDGSVVLYESPYRLVKLLGDIATFAPTRPVVLGREMTKMHEEYLAGTAGELVDILEKRGKVLGECSVLVGPSKNV